MIEWITGIFQNDIKTGNHPFAPSPPKGWHQEPIMMMMIIIIIDNIIMRGTA